MYIEFAWQRHFYALLLHALSYHYLQHQIFGPDFAGIEKYGGPFAAFVNEGDLPVLSIYDVVPSFIYFFRILGTEIDGVS